MFISQIILILLFFVLAILSYSRFSCNGLNRHGIIGRFDYCHVSEYLLLVILTVLCVMRPEQMADYGHYVTAFNHTFSERFEPTFYLIRDLAVSFGWDYIGLFFIYAVLSISIKSYCITRMSDQIWLSYLIWISTSFILMDMITIRASVSTGLMLLAIKYRCDNRILKSLVIIIAAVLFHYSAAILLIIIFLSPRKGYRIFYIWIIPVCFFIQMVGLTISNFIPLLDFAAFQNLYRGYSDDNAANLYNLLTLGRCLVAILLWLKFNNWKDRNPYAVLSVKIYTWGCALFMLFGDLLRVGFRFAELMWCADIIAYTMLTYLFTRKSKWIPIAVCGILLFITITKQSYWNPSNI